MLIDHAGKRPTIDPTAWVAPDATLCGDVTIGPGVRILHGARLVGEAGGAIRIGRDVIIMENAVIRASTKHPCTIGDHCLIGPSAHVTGATLEDEVFVATGAAIFHGAALGRGSEVRVHATVHCARVSSRAPWCRSDGWPSATRRASCRPTGTTRSGRSRSR
jgi:carbonic anhydrase/acetyltransferase-like protein (isoleucine patch superfamily)